MNDLDDDMLRDAFAARAGGDVDTAGVRAAVVGRAQRVRTRRTVLAGSATAVLLVGGLAVLTLDRDSTVEPADRTTPVTSSESTVTTMPAADTTLPATSPPAPSTSAPDEVPATGAPEQPGPDAAGGSTDDPMPTPTTGPLPAATTPASTDGAGPGPGTTQPSPTAPTSTQAPASTDSPTSTQAPGPAPFTRTYDSAGGSITVSWNGTSLTLLGTSPTGGHEPEIETQEPTRVRVRFRGPSDSRIEVRIRDAQVEVSVS